MPPKPPTQQMGEKHEEYLAEVNAGRKSNASGSKWQDPADGRNAHDLPYAFAWDGKSTHSASITVTLAMIAKIREQALGELPQIGLRWYATEDLTSVHEDWVAVPGDSWQDILASARAWVELEAALGSVSRDDLAGVIRAAETAGELSVALNQARQDLLDAGERIAAKDLELETLRGQAGVQAAPQGVPGHMVRFVPRLPWAVVQMNERSDRRGSAGDPVATVTDYDVTGRMRLYTAQTVRVQRSMANRPQIFVDEGRYRDADVYQADGTLLARCCDDDPSTEVG